MIVTWVDIRGNNSTQFLVIYESYEGEYLRNCLGNIGGRLVKRRIWETGDLKKSIYEQLFLIFPHIIARTSTEEERKNTANNISAMENFRKIFEDNIIGVFLNRVSWSIGFFCLP